MAHVRVVCRDQWYPSMGYVYSDIDTITVFPRHTLGLKGPDPSEWSEAARAQRGASRPDLGRTTITIDSAGEFYGWSEPDPPSLGPLFVVGTTAAITVLIGLLLMVIL